MVQLRRRQELPGTPTAARRVAGDSLGSSGQSPAPPAVARSPSSRRRDRLRMFAFKVPLPSSSADGHTRPGQRHDRPRGVLTSPSHVARAGHTRAGWGRRGLLKTDQHESWDRCPCARVPARDRPPLREHFLVRPTTSIPRLSSIRGPVAHPRIASCRKRCRERRHRDPPGVPPSPVQVDVALVASQDFAERAHADERPGVVAHRSAERAAESRRIHDVRREHRMAAVSLVAVASDEAGWRSFRFRSAGM